MGPGTLKLDLVVTWWHVACFEESGETIRQSGCNFAADFGPGAGHVRAAAVVSDVHEVLQVVIRVRNGQGRI